MAEVEKGATWVATTQADLEGAFLLLHRIMEREEDGVGAAAGKTAGSSGSCTRKNVRPLKCGRNTKLLNRALKVQVDRDLKASVFQTSRKAKPIEKLEAAYRAFLVCSTKRSNKEDQ
ncbi:hypothetical protein ZIOFF_043743 [Zingiber officinale]|uniref:Uncharacterized protein n=1 Tax=Zingiber officinale TaxID=94328 RepID=A0A8J5KWM2_ZINOF|nr:hypothetical protein ZIOFF_043743 [Zingiber officinale]